MANQREPTEASINAEIASIYRTHWDRLSELVRAQTASSSPLLLSVPPEFLAQPARLVVCGQQTNTWYNDYMNGDPAEAVVARLMSAYAVELAAGVRPSSPFWQAVHKLEGALGVAFGKSVWTNLIRVDVERARPGRAFERALLEAFPAFLQEVGLLRPSAVIFFTGPRYDGALASVVPECQLEETANSFIKRVVHERLPHHAYRTFHPNYLRRQRQEESVLGALAAFCSTIPTSFGDGINANCVSRLPSIARAKP